MVLVVLVEHAKDHSLAGWGVQLSGLRGMVGGGGVCAWVIRGRSFVATALKGGDVARRSTTSISNII